MALPLAVKIIDYRLSTIDYRLSAFWFLNFEFDNEVPVYFAGKERSPYGVAAEAYTFWCAAVCRLYSVCCVYDERAARGEDLECLILDHTIVCSCQRRCEKFPPGAPYPLSLLLYTGKAIHVPYGKDAVQHYSHVCDEYGKPCAFLPYAGLAAGAKRPLRHHHLYGQS